MADALDLHAFAEVILDACIESLDTIPVADPTLAGAPTRRFVSPGTPVWDCCEQLAVHVPGIGELATTPGGLDVGRRADRSWRNDVTFLATITRCIPTATSSSGGDVLLPDPVALASAAAQINADAWALWNHLHNMKASGDLLTLCDEMYFDGINAAVPMGGCAGWTVRIRAVIDGYQESLGS